MSQLKEILERERERGTLERCAVIHLFREGTFYRAYEWSAWLCVRYIQQFKATRRVLKSQEGSVVFVGFPVTSLAKFTPEGATATVEEDKGAEIMLPATVFPPEAGIEALSEDFGNWKSSVPLAGSSKKETEGRTNGSGHPTRVTDIMHLILAYPIEQKSPLECMAFLADIKQKIAEII